MSGPLTYDKTKRTTPCSEGCRHPLCVELAKAELARELRWQNMPDGDDNEGLEECDTRSNSSRRG